MVGQWNLARIRSTWPFGIRFGGEAELVVIRIADGKILHAGKLIPTSNAAIWLLIVCGLAFALSSAMRSRIILLALLVLTALPVSLQAQRVSHAPVGLRDRVGAGLHIGLPAALRGDFRFMQLDSNALALEAYFGVSGTTWGLGESYAALLRFDMQTASDRANDAMIVAPAVGIAAMEPSDPWRGWWDWSPYETVHSVLAICEVSWIHEFSSWSLELGVAPGENYAFDGRDKNNQPAKGQYSFQFSMFVGARFFH